MIYDRVSKFKIVGAEISSEQTVFENRLLLNVVDLVYADGLEYQVSVFKFLTTPERYNITYEDATNIWAAFMNGEDDVITFYNVKYPVIAADIA